MFPLVGSTTVIPDCSFPEDSASQIIAAARSPEKAQDLAEKGVQVREFDYDRPETMDAALEGVEKILLISRSAAVR